MGQMDNLEIQGGLQIALSDKEGQTFHLNLYTLLSIFPSFNTKFPSRDTKPCVALMSVKKKHSLTGVRSVKRGRGGSTMKWESYI
jgi:hypothetical protein